MNPAILLKLMVLVAVVAAGWYAGRTPIMAGPEPITSLSALAFCLLTPALLFRATARIDLVQLPWATLLGFFAPVVAWLLGVLLWHRWRGQPPRPGSAAIVVGTVSFAVLAPMWLQVLILL